MRESCSGKTTRSADANLTSTFGYQQSPLLAPTPYNTIATGNGSGSNADLGVERAPILQRSFSEGDWRINAESLLSERDGKLFEIRRNVHLDTIPMSDLAQYRQWASTNEIIRNVVAFVNSGSGNQVGRAIASELEKLECTVCDLHDPLEPRLTLHNVKMRNAKRNRFIVLGGDGTITWMLREMEKYGVKGGVGVIPLGTGNDLSRSLGWGPHLENVSDVFQYLQWVARADEVALDSWRITVTTDDALPPNHKLYTAGSHPRPTKKTNTFVGYFQNYFSVGLDARVTYDVEECRTKNKFGRLMFRRGLGKCCYALAGLKECLVKGLCARILTPHVKLEPPISLADRHIQSCLSKGRCRQISIVNINSFGAGQKVHHGSQDPSDGLIEVLALRNSLFGLGIYGHCNAMHFVDALPEITLRFQKETYMQIDGEPWYMPGPCTVKIELSKKVTMLRAPEDAYFTARQRSTFWDNSAGLVRETERTNSSATPDCLTSACCTP